MNDSSIDEDPPSTQLNPLTHYKQDGSLLKRDPRIEAQIVDTLVLDLHDLLERASITDKDSLAYLQEETLVYLIREFLALGITVVFLFSYFLVGMA